MRKRFLLCELDDENYAYAKFSLHKEYEEAAKEAVSSCREWHKDCDIEEDDSGFMITGRYGDSFYVTEIKQICADCGTHLLIWHHGYEGVDFEVRFQGTREECETEMKKEIKELVDDLELCDEDIFGNTIDTRAEWEVFDIVEIENN